MNVTQQNLPEVNLSELQTRRFSESLNEIITQKHDPKLKFEDGIMIAAKVNTNKPLHTRELNALCYFADSWNQELTISRSGTGVKIEFEIKKD